MTAKAFPPIPLRAIWVSCRPRQWIKNGFVLLPLLFGELLFVGEAWVQALTAVAAFGLAASGSYLLNDVLDREGDQANPFKSRRPVAAGELSVSLARVSAGVLGCGSLLVAFSLQFGFGVVIALYLVINLLYSKWLRQIVLVDVFCVASFFVLRVLGGIFVLKAQISFWMLILTALLALFLALNKRRYELIRLKDLARVHRSVLEKYSSHFIDQMCGAIAGAAITIYSLFVMDPQTVEKFGNHNLLFSIPWVWFGIFRYQHLVFHRGRGGDPSEIVLGDRAMKLTLVLWVLTAGLAIYSKQDWILVMQQ